MECCWNLRSLENWLHESSEWVTNEKTPLDQKICVVASFALSWLAASYCMAIFLSPPAIIGAVVLANVAVISFLVCMDRGKIEHHIEPLSPRQWITFFLKVHEFPYETLPVIEMNRCQRDQNRWEQDLMPSNLNSTVMKGVNCRGEPFLAIKVIDRNQDDHCIVLIVYIDEGRLFIPNCEDSNLYETSLSDGHFMVNSILSRHSLSLGRFRFCRNLM